MKNIFIEAYKRGLREGFQSLLNTLSDREKSFIGELDPEKSTITFGDESKCAAILTKGMTTKSGKQAYWLVIATHPDYRGKGLASKVLKDEVLPFIRKNDGVLFSKIKASNTASKKWHEKLGAKKITDKGDWEIFEFSS